MSLRPIDMLAPIQRGGDVIQSSNNAAHRPEYLHQQFSERLQREADHNEKHVRQPNKAEEGAVRREDRGRQGRGSGKGGKDKEKKKAALSALMHGNILDIRV